MCRGRGYSNRPVKILRNLAKPGKRFRVAVYSWRRRSGPGRRSRREDVLDTVIALKRPKDYDVSEGARFEIHFDKSRGFAGDDAKPIEAKLEINAFGFAEWKSQPLDQSYDEEIKAMTNDGKSQRQIALELGIAKTAVQRRQKVLIEQ